MTQSCEDGNCSLTGTDGGTPVQICTKICNDNNIPYCRSKSGKLKGDIILSTGENISTKKITPTCDWMKNNLKTYCDDEKCQNILKDVISASKTKNGVSIDKIVTGLGNNAPNALKQLLSDIVASGSYSSSSGKSKIKALGEYAWFQKNNIEEGSGNVAVLLISLAIIFLLTANSIYNTVFKSIKSINNSTYSGDLKNTFNYINYFIAGLIIFSILLGIVKFLGNWLIGDQIDKINTGEIPDLSTSDVVKFLRTSIPIILFVGAIVLLLYIQSQVADVSLILPYIGMMALIIPYVLMTGEVYSYAPKLMVSFSLMVFMGQMIAIAVSKITGSNLVNSIVMGLVYVIIMAIAIIVWLTAGADTDVKLKKNEEYNPVTDNGSLIQMVLYVCIFSIIKIIVLVFSASQDGSYFKQFNIATKNNFNQNENKLGDLLSQHFGFLNEDLVKYAMNFFINKVTG